MSVTFTGSTPVTHRCLRKVTQVDSAVPGSRSMRLLSVVRSKYPFVWKFPVRVFGAFGLEVRRAAPSDLRDEVQDPRRFFLDAASLLKRPIVVNVALDRCRSTIGTAFSASHPYVAMLHPSPPASFDGSKLERFYRTFQPRTPAQALDINECDAPGFIGMPPTAFLMPWQPQTPQVIAERRREIMAQESREHGVQIDADAGYNHFGPVTSAKGRLEFARLTRIHQSMSRHGFVRHDQRDGDIGGCLLTQSDGNWCVQVIGGQHRCAVASALQLKTVPVRFRVAPIKREDVSYWPQVAGGRFTRDGALAVFDRVMRGDWPQSADVDQWADNADQKQ